MTEYQINIRFIQPCLGNSKDEEGRFMLPRDVNGNVFFAPTWHRSNMLFAARLCNKHQEEVKRIAWNASVILLSGTTSFHRVYYQSGGRYRYRLHEALLPGALVGLRCVVPATISEDQVTLFMEKAGQFRGLSPWRQHSYGRFDVIGIRHV